MSHAAGTLRVAAGLAVRARPGSLAGMVLIAVVQAANPVAAAWLMKAIIDTLVRDGAGGPPLAGLVAALAAVGVTEAVMAPLSQLCQGELSRGVALRAQDRLYAAVNSRVGLAWYESPAQLDRLRLAQQCGEQSPAQLVNVGFDLMRAMVMIVGFVGSLLVISPWIAAIVVAGAAPLLVAEVALSRARVGVARAVTPRERREAFYGMLLGLLPAAMEIRVFGIGDHLRARMRGERRAADALRRRLDRRTVVLHGAPSVVSAVVAGAGLIWAAYQVRAGAMTVGDLTMFVAAIASMQGGLAAIVSNVAFGHEHLRLFDSYVQIVSAGPDLPVVEPRRDLPPLRDGVELVDVWFRYGEHLPWVLRGVNLTLRCGESVGLVGVNGAGKSTLVKLLCRFYDPTRGSIRWDGVDIRQVPPEQLRARLSTIFQDYMCYDLTAAENIALGDLDRAQDRASLQRAAAAAGIHDVLADLPGGYDTMLGRAFTGEDGEDGGVTLSGGQWQRVALARALLRRDRDLTILDEPSARLDPVAQAEIAGAIREHGQGRTRLLVSHRLNEIRTAHRVVVLAEGRIVEQGHHDRLMAADGQYARMFQAQAAGYQLAIQ